MTAVSISRTTNRIPLTTVVTLVPVAAALNIVGGTINESLRLPTFLDMIGTAVAAIVLGPWWGALVGVIGNVTGSFVIGPVQIPFALANVAGALVWGYGVRSLGMGSSMPRFLILNILVALAVSAVAAPIVVFVFGGATGHSSDVLTAAFATAGQELLTAVFASSVLASLADKIISGFVAVSIIHGLPANLSYGLRLPAVTGMRPVLLSVIGVVIGVGIMFVFLLIKPAAAA